MGACPWGVLGEKGGSLTSGRDEGLPEWDGGSPYGVCVCGEGGGGAPTWLHHGVPTAAPHLLYMLCLLPSQHQAWAADL